MRSTLFPSRSGSEGSHKQETHAGGGYVENTTCTKERDGECPSRMIPSSHTAMRQNEKQGEIWTERFSQVVFDTKPFDDKIPSLGERTPASANMLVETRFLSLHVLLKIALYLPQLTRQNEALVRSSRHHYYLCWEPANARFCPRSNGLHPCST